MNITFHTGRIGSGNSTADREDPLEGRKRNPKTTGSGPYAFPPGWELFPRLRFAGSDSVKNDQSDLESVIYQQCELPGVVPFGADLIGIPARRERTRDGWQRLVERVLALSTVLVPIGLTPLLL